MLKAMLVDDEVLSIKMLENLIDWESYGIEIAATASDGMEAFEKFQTYSPNIIITDIKMPNLSGIDFMKKVREINSDVDFIMMSAYADFNFAKKAIQLGGSDYILKPIDEYELECALKKIVSKISDKKVAQKLVVKSELQRKKHVLRSFMKTGANLLAANKCVNNLNVDFSHYAVMSFILNNNTINEYVETSNLISAQINYVMDRMSGILRQYGVFLLFDYEEYSWVAILSNCNVDQIAACSKDMIEFFRNEPKVNINVCFSGVASGVDALPQLYKRLQQLNRYSFYVNNSNILGYGYNCKEEEFDKIEVIVLAKNMAAALKQRNTVEAVQILNQMLHISESISPLSLDSVYEFCYETILCVKKILISNNEITAESQFVLDLTYLDLAEISSMQKLQDFMIRMIQLVSGEAYPNHQEKYSKLVEQGIDFLRNNYNKNISLDEICEQLSVSKNYFCYLFKRETGKNLWAYLTEIRMSKSEEFLRSTDMKSYEIAYNVGYDNPSYFSKLFKKLHSQTPNEYRENSK